MGLIPLSTNTTVEPNFRMASPASVTIHTQLVYSGLECSPENTDAMSSDVEQAARHLVTAQGGRHRRRLYRWQIIQKKKGELIQPIERTGGG